MPRILHVRVEVTVRLLQIRYKDTASETENPSACAAVNCKVCRIAIAL
jgi:hypothetical protein